MRDMKGCGGLRERLRRAAVMERLWEIQMAAEGCGGLRRAAVMERLWEGYDKLNGQGNDNPSYGLS